MQAMQGSPPASQEHLTHVLSRAALKNQPTFSAEVIPPRNGADPQRVLEQVKALRDTEVDFISVTKGAGGSLRGGTLPIAQVIRQSFGVCSLAHFTCRDATREDVESSLVDHHYLGIRNILALRGDPPDGKPAQDWSPSAAQHKYAFQLVEQIRHMNEGKYLVREGYDLPTDTEPGGAYSRNGMKTDFCIGVAAYPEEEHGVEFFQKKIQAGANFAITQMIYDAEAYESFLERSQAPIPVLPGIRILTSFATAERMKNKFGIRVPQKLFDLLAKAKASGQPAEDGRKVGLEFAYGLSEDLLRRGAPGIHLFIMNDEVTACELMSLLRTSSSCLSQ